MALRTTVGKMFVSVLLSLCLLFLPLSASAGVVSRTSSTTGGSGDISTVGSCISGDCTSAFIDNASIDWSDIVCLESDGASFDESYGSDWSSDSCPAQKAEIYNTFGATPAGDLGGTWSNPSVDNDSHTHNVTNLTNLTEGYIIVGSATDTGAATNQLPNLSISAFPSSDDTWSGIAISGTAGYATTQWDVVFLDAVGNNNKFEKADANVSGDFPAWGLATGAVAEDAALIVIVKGCIRNDGWNGSFTHGDLLYLDETTAGGLVASASAPDTAGDCVQPIGRFFDKGSDTYLCIDVNPVSGWATVP